MFLYISAINYFNVKRKQINDRFVCIVNYFLNILILQKKLLMELP